MSREVTLVLAAPTVSRLRECVSIHAGMPFVKNRVSELSRVPACALDFDSRTLPFAASGSRPVFNREATDALELLRVGGNESSAAHWRGIESLRSFSPATVKQEQRIGFDGFGRLASLQHALRRLDRFLNPLPRVVG